MGQAKNRGSFEERRAASVAKAQAAELARLEQIQRASELRKMRELERARHLGFRSPSQMPVRSSANRFPRNQMILAAMLGAVGMMGYCPVVSGSGKNI